MEIKTKPNHVDDYLVDVAFVGLTTEQVAALRNTFSDRGDNRAWASGYRHDFINALRQSESVTSYHTWYKETIRDVNTDVEEDDDDLFEDDSDSDEDPYEDWD